MARKLREVFHHQDRSIKTSVALDWRFDLEIERQEAEQVLARAAIALTGEMLQRLLQPDEKARGHWKAVFCDLMLLCHRFRILQDVETDAAIHKRLPPDMSFDDILFNVRGPKESSGVDLYDLIERIPLPNDIRPQYDLGLYHDPSLLCLLSASLSYGLPPKGNTDLNMSLLVFAASCVVTQMPAASYSVDCAETVSQAVSWLATQLPQRKFSWTIEDLIRKTPRDWYYFEKIGKAPPPPKSGPSRPSGKNPDAPRPKLANTQAPRQQQAFQGSGLRGQTAKNDLLNGAAAPDLSSPGRRR